MKMIEDGEGKASLRTVEPCKLWPIQDSKKIVLKDEKGRFATASIAIVFQSNRVIHVIDTEVRPN